MLRRLLPFVWPRRAMVLEATALLLAISVLDTTVLPFLLAAILLCVVGSSGVAAGTPFTMKVFGWDMATLLSHVPVGHDRVSVLLAIAGAATAAVLAKCACDARRLYVCQRFGLLVASDLRQRLFRSLVAQPVAFHDAQQAGTLVSRITGDLGGLQDLLGVKFFELVQAPVAVAIGLAVLLALSWQLTVATLCLAPPVAWIIWLITRRVRDLTTRRHDRLANLNAYLAERLANMRIIHAFAREDSEIAEMQRLNRGYFREAMRAGLAADIISPLSETVALAGMLTGILLGGIAVIRGSMAREHFLVFFAVAPMASTYVGRLARIGPIRQQIAGTTARVFALLDVVPSICDSAEAVPLPPVRGRIAFDAVSFRYGAGESAHALDGVDLEIKPGEVVALVGPSGAGKTTMVSLLLRFFDPTSGRVMIDGHDLRGVTLASLRAQIGLVSQEAILFNRTVADNIRYGRLDASDEEVRQAARAAYALEFVERLPTGFDTLVGERGTTLSAGQRQRLAIARALLRDPRILILDEATSALDSESEQMVQSALARIVRGRTTLVVAHRLSTVRHVDRLVVLDRGKIVQAGSHDYLVAVPGLYQRLYALQTLEPGEAAGPGDAE
jgi:subfamily B ATP-binding cassette protein MsbA